MELIDANRLTDVLMSARDVDRLVTDKNIATTIVSVYNKCIYLTSSQPVVERRADEGEWTRDSISGVDDTGAEICVVTCSRCDTPNALYVGCALPLICPKCRARMRNGGIPTR